MPRAASSGPSGAGHNRHRRARPLNIRTLDELKTALRETGMTLGVILGIDFTESNLRTGRTSYNGQSLHQLGDGSNPYQEALVAIMESWNRIGEPLTRSGEVNQIHCFGFGGGLHYAALGQGEYVFNFFDNEGYCAGFDDVLYKYAQLTPDIELTEPTSFAPIIERAIKVVEESDGQYHVLLIITDGEVSERRVQETADAITSARRYPLFIIEVGVGDKPGRVVEKFASDNNSRCFDNFQFVNFTKIMRRRASPETKLFAFARKALKKLPSQWRVAVEEGLLGRARHNNVSIDTDTGNTSSSSSADKNQRCIICKIRKEHMMAFPCGHQTCGDCADKMQRCPFCRTPIAFRIRLL